MKKLIAGVVALATFPLAASAHFASDGFYASLFGGATFPQNPGSGITAKTGLDLGAAIGMKQSNLRYEGEFSWQRNNLTALGATGRANIVALMANLHYDFDELDIHSQIVPSLGAGIGWAHARTSGGGANANDNAFAYQLMVNVFYHFTSDISMNVGYKFFGTTKFNNIANKAWNSHMINVGATYRMG